MTKKFAVIHEGKIRSIIHGPDVRTVQAAYPTDEILEVERRPVHGVAVEDPARQRYAPAGDPVLERRGTPMTHPPVLLEDGEDPTVYLAPRDRVVQYIRVEPIDLGRDRDAARAAARQLVEIHACRAGPASLLELEMEFRRMLEATRAIAAKEPLHPADYPLLAHDGQTVRESAVEVIAKGRARAAEVAHLSHQLEAIDRLIDAAETKEEIYQLQGSFRVIASPSPAERIGFSDR